MTQPNLRVYIGFGSTWQTEPGDIDWINVTDQVMDRRQPVTFTRGATSIHGDIDTGQLDLTLRNNDRRFDPLNVDGDYYGMLKPGVPVKVVGKYESALVWDGDPLVWDGDDLVWAPPATPLWRGTVKSWPQHYDRGNQSATVPITAYDGFDKLSRAKIPRSVMEAAIMPLNPVGYWPLTDPSGSVAVTDVVGSHFGTVVDEPSLGSDELAPGLGTSIEFDGVNDRIDVATAPLVPDPLASGATVMAVFSTEVPADASSIHPIYLQLDGNNAATSHQLFVETDGTIVHCVSTDAVGTLRTHSTLVDDGDPHIVIGVGGPGTDGVAIDSADLESVSVVGVPQGGWGVAIGGTPNASKGYDDNYFPGRISHVAVWDYELDLGERQSIIDAYAALDGQATDERVDWILDELGWPVGLRSLRSGESLLGPATFRPGDNALEYLRACAATEDALMFINADGELRLLDRYWRYTAANATVPQVAFTDDGTEVSVSQFVIEPADDEHLVNVAKVGSPTIALQVATDEASKADYGEVALTIDTVHASAALALSQAQWTVATRSTPTPRVPMVTVNLHGLPVLDQAAILALEIGHRVTCARTPQGVGDPFSVDCVVAGINHEVTAATWVVEFYLSPAPDATVSLFTLGTSTLGGVDVLAY